MSALKEINSLFRQVIKMLRFILVTAFVLNNTFEAAAEISIRINLGNAKIGGNVRIDDIQKGFTSATVNADKAEVKGSTTLQKIKADKVNVQ